MKDSDPRVYPVGKLPVEDLDRILKRYATITDSRLLVGPGVGQDAAVIDFGLRKLVVKTDPITFATEQIGWYAVHINANDIAAMGATPRWFLATALLPENATTPEMVESIFAGLTEACRELQVTLCGGHTEITYGLSRPIIVGQMLGEAEQFVSPSAIRPGDDVALTKGFPIEAAALIALEKGEELQGEYTQEFIASCRNYLRNPGLSVVPEARIAMETGGVRAMHDPTEGGVATGLRELCMAAGIGLLVEEDALPILPESLSLCRRFGLDPLGVIASGALIIIMDPSMTTGLLSRLSEAGIAATVIGTMQDATFGVKIRRGKKLENLPVFRRDEIGKLFEPS